MATVLGSKGILAKIKAFLRVKYSDRQLDFDGCHFDTAWYQIFYCLRSGFYSEAVDVAESAQGIVLIN